jgi:hypothetical protein
MTYNMMTYNIMCGRDAGTTEMIETLCGARMLGSFTEEMDGATAGFVEHALS